MQQTTDTLAAKFPVSGLRFESGQGGLIKAVLEAADSVAEIYLHGAHVASYKPKGHKPLLWMSQRSLFEDGKAIRGGVPICFPWFGPHPSDPQLPGHGLARVKSWEVIAARHVDGDALQIELATDIDDFRLQYRVSCGSTLRMSLNVQLSPQAAGPRRFEEALHTYFSVNDISDVMIEGLEDAEYIDKVDGGKRKPATGSAIRFQGECDRVYLDTTATCTLHDPGNRRSIAISKSNSQSTVVWNPWIDKSARMADFGDNEWPEMVCVETANVGPHSIELSPGQSHEMNVEVAVSTR
ncbi:MAG: D-hexose-6-phosphate mutarotase [Planctomycetaceae bacterium]